jgi:hypothetical protein
MSDSEFARLTSAARHVTSAISEQVRDVAAIPGGKPLPPGATAPPVQLPPQQSGAMFVTSFVATVGGPAAASPTGAPPAVVWRDGEHELLISPGRARLLLQDGFALVGIFVYAEQTGAVEIAVPFAVGRPSAPTGLMIATEPVPRGPALLVERWGDQLIAAAWHALLTLAAGVAAAAGTDTGGAPLIPVSLIASPDGLTVLPQAAPIATPPGKPAGPGASR